MGFLGSLWNPDGRTLLLFLPFGHRHCSFFVFFYIILLLWWCCVFAQLFVVPWLFERFHCHRPTPSFMELQIYLARVALQPHLQRR